MKNIGINIDSKSKLIYIVVAVLLMVISIGSVIAIYMFGITGAILPTLGAFGLIFVYAVLRLPRFGVLALMVLAYFIMFIISINFTTFPLGTVMDALLGLLVLGFFMQQKYYRNFKVFNNTLGYLILIWILYNLLQVFNPNASSKLAWMYTIRSVSVVMLSYYIFTYYIISINFLKVIIKVWLGLALFAAIYAMKQEYIGFFPFEEYNHYDPLIQSLLFIDGHWRKNSIFSDPVAFSYNMAAAAIMCIALITSPAINLKKKIGLGFLGAIFAFVMTYSGTRASYILIPAAGIMLVILKMNKSILALAAAGALGLYVLVNIPTGNVTLYRFQSAFKPNNDASYNVRKATQKKIQPFIQDHPMGGGLGGSGVWGVRFAPNSFLAKFPPDSGYVRVGMELGWIGLFLICTIMFSSLYYGIKHYFLIRDPELKSYCFGMVMIIYAICIANFPQEAIVQFPMNVYFYLFLAIIQVTKILDDKKFEEENLIEKKRIKVIE